MMSWHVALRLGGYVGSLPDLPHMLPQICKAFNSPVIMMYQSQDSALRMEMARAQLHLK